MKSGAAKAERFRARVVEWLTGDPELQTATLIPSVANSPNTGSYQKDYLKIT